MLRQFIPRRVKDAIKVLCGVAIAVPNDPKQIHRFCPVCRRGTEFLPLPFSYLRQLESFGFPYPLFKTETMNFEEYSCRQCGASDRERLFAMYFDREWRGPGSILEVAPNAMTGYLRSLPGATVRTADLNHPAADDCVDITNMSLYVEGQFDTWICSHVLEHVSDDRAAMRELYRVLKSGGWGLVMVPIWLSVQATHEDVTITDPALRWKHFGQDDHVRLYAKADFIERLESVGFIVDCVRGESFGAAKCERVGIDPNSVLYVVRKPKNADGD